MSNCEYYEELISRLVDSELSKNEYDALWLHMKSCSRCNAMYAAFNAMSDILAGDAEPLPAGLHENIMAGIRRSEMARKNRIRLSRPVRNTLAAAACAAFVLFAVRGLISADKMKSSVITAPEAAQTETWENSVPASGAAPAETIAEAAATAEPDSSVPMQTAAPTADIYLSTEAPVSASPAPVTPAPAASPAQAPDVVLSPHAVSAPLPSASSYTPAPEEVGSVGSPDASDDAHSSSDVGFAAAAVPENSAPIMNSEAVVSDAAAETTVPTAAVALTDAVDTAEKDTASTEAPPLLMRGFKSLFTASASKAAAPEAAADTAASPEPTGAADKITKVTITEKDDLNEIINILCGTQKELPSGAADKVFLICFSVGSDSPDSVLRVSLFGEEVYYVSLGGSEETSFSAECSADEFEAFVARLAEKDSSAVTVDAVGTSEAVSKTREESVKETLTPAVEAEAAK